MKRFYTIIAMALVVTVASFAQMLPKGPVVPYSGIKRDMGASLKAKDNVLVTLPETAVVEDDWAIDAIYYYGEENTPYLNDNPISVAFDGSDVYFRGVIFTCPNAWIKGKMMDNVASFSSGQYCGTYEGFDIYACGTTDLVNFSSFRFQYDPATKTFTLADFYLENNSPDQPGFLFFSYNMKVYKNIQVPVPTDLTVEPGVKSAEVSWTSDASKQNLRYRKYVDVSGSSRSWDFEDKDQINEFTLVDADGDGLGWAWINSNVKAHSGKGVLYSMSYDNTTGALTPDNWIITPRVKLGGQVSFWACSQETNAGYANEKFQVYVLENEEWTSVDEFIAVSDVYTTSVDFQQYTIDLSDYEGYGLIAIRHFDCTDQFWLNIDDLEVLVPDASDVVQPEWTEYVDVINPITIQPLEPNTEYEVQVCGVEDGVQGLWSSSVVFKTLSEGTPAIENFYLSGTFNEWSEDAASCIAFTEVEDGVYEAKADLEANAQFKVISFAQDGSTIWMGGTDETGAGHYDVTQELLDVPTALYVNAGANFKLAAEPAVYKIRINQAPSTMARGLVEPLQITVSYHAPSAIETVSAGTVDTTWYNLQGVRFNSKPTTPGIYINGGRKVVIR